MMKSFEMVLTVMLTVMLVLMLMMMGVTEAHAIPIADDNQVVHLTYDLSTPPGDTSIWNNSGPYGFPHDYEGYRGGWVCRSDSDSKNGSCPEKLSWVPSGQREINLLFTEKNGLATAVLNLVGFKPTACGELPFYSGAACYDSNTLSVQLPQTELAKIPFGGIWTAKLLLDAQAWEAVTQEATFTADITLNVTDTRRADIFFPQYNTAVPEVNLNLNTRPQYPKTQVTGGARLDMCLYDGYNLNSSWLEIKVTDPQAVPGRPDDTFSILEASGQDDGHRLDYKVRLNYSGQQWQMRNGQPVRLPLTGQGPSRPVNLPGFSGTVLCAPASLDLEVVPFVIQDKSAGDYQGQLQVEMTASAATVP